MKIVVFGATGRTGIPLVQLALDAGYEVVAFARTPSRLPIVHERLTIVKGDIQNAGAVESAVIGADAVISVLGPTSNKPDFAITKGTQNILDAMNKHGVKRLVITAGAGVGDPNDVPRFINRVISLLLKLLSRNVYEDMVRVVELVRGSDRDWTIVRVPMLTDQNPTGNIRVGYVGKGTGAKLSRRDMAFFLLSQVESDSYLRLSPVISN